MTFELRVPLWLWIISQVIGLVQIVFWVIIYQQRNKAKQLKLSAGANAVALVVNLMVFNFVRAGMKVVAVLKSLVFWQINKRQETGRRVSITARTIIAFVACSLNIAMAAIVWWLVAYVWFDWVLLAAAFVTNFAKLFGGIHAIKLGGILWNITSTINCLMFLNITGVVTNMIILGSIVAWYIRRGWREPSPPFPSSESPAQAEPTSPAPEPAPTPAT